MTNLEEIKRKEARQQKVISMLRQKNAKLDHKMADIQGEETRLQQQIDTEIKKLEAIQRSAQNNM